VDINLLQYYDIYTKDNVLYIKRNSEFQEKQCCLSINPTKILLTVSSEQLEGIETTGSSIFNFCTAFSSKELNLKLTGSGKIFADKFPTKIENCKINISGSGKAHLNGTVQEAKINISGSGKVHLKGTVQEAKINTSGSGGVSALDCKITRLSVDISGSGGVEAHVIDKLDVDLAGSGSMKFKGNPEIKHHVSGSGRVVKL
jgi:hypothetical protein